MIFLAVFFLTFSKYFSSKQKSKLEKRKTELMDEIKKTQKQYFIDGMIDKSNYENLAFRLESELKEINDLIKEGEKK